jgi:hypothetical protein
LFQPSKSPLELTVFLSFTREGEKPGSWYKISFKEFRPKSLICLSEIVDTILGASLILCFFLVAIKTISSSNLKKISSFAFSCLLSSEELGLDLFSFLLSIS